MFDDTLPTGFALTDQLFDLGLAPAACERMSVQIAPGHPRFWYRLYETQWQPWCRIEHCWYLVEQFEMSIVAITPLGYPHALPLEWWVEAPGIAGMRAPSFTALPTGICQAAVRAQAGRMT